MVFNSVMSCLLPASRMSSADIMTYYKRMEPNKCEGWSWRTWGELESMAANQERLKELFVPLYNLVKEFPELGKEIKDQEAAHGLNGV